MKIAMWSGPRNLSTACLYAFGNRSDFAVWDEPFYGAYLRRTGTDHPMRDVVLAETETNPNRIAEICAGDPPDGKDHWYMKHMSFHMCDGFPLDWAEDCINIHLIRHPAYVVASYVRKRKHPTLRDIGFQQQAALFDRFPGPVVDSADIRRDPEGTLRALCNQIGLGFDPAMLAWPAGPKAFDGVWAPHWYGAVHRSTGFDGQEGPTPELDRNASNLVAAALPFYEKLRVHKIG